MSDVTCGIGKPSVIRIQTPTLVSQGGFDVCEGLHGTEEGFGYRRSFVVLWERRTEGERCSDRLGINAPREPTGLHVVTETGESSRICLEWIK